MKKGGRWCEVAGTVECGAGTTGMSCCLSLAWPCVCACALRHARAMRGGSAKCSLLRFVDDWERKVISRSENFMSCCVLLLICGGMCSIYEGVFVFKYHHLSATGPDRQL